jgi:RHS repeat-associated protein
VWFTNSCGTVPTGAVTYTYDAEGNQTASSAGAANTYNPLNQTASMTAKTGSTPLAMTYTGTDSTLRTAAGGTTFTNNALGVASSTTSGTTPYFTRDPTGRLNNLAVGGTTYYYLYDGTGDVIGLINTSGAQVATYTYGPYGNTSSTGTNFAVNPFRFQAGYLDTTGYYKYGTRYYNQALGSWAQQDPQAGTITNPTTLLTYPYAGNDPINASDPTGRDCTQSECGTPSVSGYDSATAGGLGFCLSGLAGVVTGIFVQANGVIAGKVITEIASEDLTETLLATAAGGPIGAAGAGALIVVGALVSSC